MARASLNRDRVRHGRDWGEGGRRKIEIRGASRVLILCKLVLFVLRSEWISMESRMSGPADKTSSCSSTQSSHNTELNKNKLGITDVGQWNSELLASTTMSRPASNTCGQWHHPNQILPTNPCFN